MLQLEAIHFGLERVANAIFRVSFKMYIDSVIEVQNCIFRLYPRNTKTLVMTEIIKKKIIEKIKFFFDLRKKIVFGSNNRIFTY